MILRGKNAIIFCDFMQAKIIPPVPHFYFLGQLGVLAAGTRREAAQSFPQAARSGGKHSRPGALSQSVPGFRQQAYTYWPRLADQYSFFVSDI